MIVLLVPVFIFLGIVLIAGFCTLLSVKSDRVKARLREEKRAAEIEAARKAAAERAEAQKPYNEKALAWVKARQAEGEPKQTYGEYGRLWGFPIDTQEEFDAFRQSAYAEAIELQPSRRGGAYEVMQEQLNALLNARYPSSIYSLSHGYSPLYRNCHGCGLQTSRLARHCPRCGAWT